MLPLGRFLLISKFQFYRVLVKAENTALTEGIIMTGWIADFMNHPATFLHSGWFQISITNLLVILLMITIFALSVLIPFPKEKDGHNK